MEQSKLEQYLSTLPGAESSYPFGPEALVYKVMGKMFALVSQLDDSPRLTVKIVPADGEVLVEQFAAIIPGYHMNKRHWITLTLDGDVPDSMMIDLSKQSYELVAAKLTKAEKNRLALL